MRAKIEEKLTAIGVTGPGRDWVIKALDPATTGPAPGIPDTSATQVLRPEYTARCAIQGPSTAASWDCYLFFPPGDVNAVVWAAAPSSTGGANFAAGISSAPLNAQCGVCQLQPAYEPAGYTTVQSLPVGGETTSTAVNAAMRVPANQAATMRTQYRSITIELSAPDVANQGEVYAGQFPTVARSSRWQNFNGVSTSSGYISAGNVDYVPLPLHESDLTLACRNAYVGKAKDGIYMPMRLMGPTQPFAEVETTCIGTWNAPPFVNPHNVAMPLGQTVQWPRLQYACSNDTAGESAPSAIGWTITDSWINTAYGSVVPGQSPQNTLIGDTGYDNCMTGVVIFRGLAGPGGGGFGSSVGATLTVKALVGLEVVPRPTSVERVFQKPPAQFNPRALEAYYAIANELAPAYPASANALGGLLPVLGSVANSLWPTVRSGLIGLRTGLADSLAPYASAPREKIVVRERVSEPRAPAARAPSVRSRVSVSVKSKRKPRRARVTMRAN